MSNPEEMLKIFQIFSSIGIALGGLSAFFALLLVGTKTLEHQWRQEFRRLYDEFWQDETAGQARRLISYQDEYDSKLKMALLVVLDNKGIPRHEATKHIKIRKNKIHKDYIDCIDIFLSKLIQIGFLTDLYFFQKRNRDMRNIFLNYWLNEIDGRPELQEYIKSEWKLFGKFVYEIRKSQEPSIMRNVKSWLTKIKNRKAVDTKADMR